jgi:ubiquinone/menaquinone biosynthesis C-methylase UbiE
MSDRPAVSHPLFARFYSRVLAPGFAKEGGDDLRRRVLADLTGTVVEVGAGDGANFALYPDDVRRIVAVEPEAYLREKAASHSDERIELRNAGATELPLGDDQADAVVFTLVLCSVDQAGALAEARRVLRPGGQLRFLEHVQADQPGTRRVQRVLDATIWPHLAGGCRLSRDTAAAIEQAGFSITELERLSIPENARGPASAAILGRAVPAGKPAV